MRAAVYGALAAAALACSRGPAGPAELDPRTETCASCRMAVSDPRFAAQLDAPSEEPRFFDDVGCLRDWLAAHPRPPAGAVAWVADHRTRAWVRAARAAYAKAPAVETPMSSHLLAFADAASRAADPAAAGARPLEAREIFGPAGPPDGAR